MCIFTNSMAQVDSLEVQKRIDEIKNRIKEKGYAWEAGITSKSFLSKEEMKRLCGLLYDEPIDNERIEAIGDSLYNEYKKSRGLKKALETQGITLSWAQWMSKIEQQECGNCWAHAATGVAEGLLHFRYGTNIEIDQDEMDITNSASCGNCSGTYWLPCGLDYIYQEKVRSEQDLNTFSNYDHGYWTVSNWSSHTVSISEIQNSLKNSPVLGGMAVYEDFQYYTGGIYEHVWGSFLGYHAIVIVGYGIENGKDYWICKNSWDIDWGENQFGEHIDDPKPGDPDSSNGYFRIAFGECGIDNQHGNITASVNHDSCYAKLVPESDGFMDLIDAVDFWTVDGEWCYGLNNVTISNGTTVTIPQKFTLAFGDNYLLSVYGTLNAQGTSANPVTFIRSGSSGTWNGIRYYSGSSGTIQYADISNAYVGIYANNSSPTISHVNISNCTYGVRPYYSSISLSHSAINNCNYGIYAQSGYPNINNSTISNCSYGVYLRYSNAGITGNEIIGCTRGVYGYCADYTDIVNNLITSGASGRVAGVQVYNTDETNLYNNTIEGNFTYGLDADHYSRPMAIGPGGQNYQGYNRILGGSTATVYARDHSEAVFGTGFTQSTEGYAGYNTIYIDTGQEKIAHIRAENYSNVLAQKNYWGDYPPMDFYADGTSSINYSYPLSSDPGGGSSLSKTTGKLTADVLSFNELPFDDTKPALTLWREITSHWQNLQYREALENCDLLLQNYPDSPYAILAFLRAVYAKRALKNTDIKEYLQKFVDIPNLRTMALELLIGENIRRQQFDEALADAETVIRENPDSEAEYKALFSLFNLYAVDLEDKESALAVLDVMKAKYPDYGLTQMAQFEMGEDVDWELARPIVFGEEPKPEVAAILPEKFQLKPNYPNPFNPTTNIAFALPEAAKVQIIIYDLTGREVWHNMQSIYNAGNYTITWDGVNQAGESVVSGIYLVQIVTPGYKATRRILLMK